MQLKVSLFFFKSSTGLTWKVHAVGLLLYLLLITFSLDGIQALQHWWKKFENHQGEWLKNKPHLVSYHESIFVSLWTFYLTLVQLVWIQSLPSPRLVTIDRLKSPICPIYSYLGREMINSFFPQFYQSSNLEWDYLYFPSLFPKTLQAFLSRVQLVWI